MWEKYKNNNGNSSIIMYKINLQSIDVKYQGGKSYNYHISNIGENHFKNMVTLAKFGNGLNSYILKNEIVKRGFTR